MKKQELITTFTQLRVTSGQSMRSYKACSSRKDQNIRTMTRWTLEEAHAVTLMCEVNW